MDNRRWRIGNQTYRDLPFNVLYKFALRHGFDAFEWFSDKRRAGWCEQDMDAAARGRLRKTATERGLLFSVHAPIAADPLHADGAAGLARSIEFAGDVGAGVVNLHLVPGCDPRRFAKAFGPHLELARAAGVCLSLENTPECSPEDFNATFAVLGKVPETAGRVCMCFDMGHANLHPGTRNDYLGFIDRLGDHVPIQHWHAHENWGDRDSHLTLFTGPSARDDTGLRGLVQRLRQRRFRGSIVLEQWPTPPELLVQARDRLRAMLGELTAP